MNKISKILNSQNVFLIDGIGALTSAFFLGFVLVMFEQFIGMPIHILLLLAILALIFALYSLSMHILKPEKWIRFLKAIGIINLAYCLLTLILIVVYFNHLTALGVAYFLVEIVVILILVKIEFRFIQANKV